jgi:probable F420-dependent oxidoreductase
LVGPTVYLAPEHKVVLTTDENEAREIGRQTIDFYLNLSNYLNSWKRLGFTDKDVAKPGSDRLIDELVAYGSADDIATRLNEHLDAGADHVTIQVLGGWDKLLPTLTELAGPLGLKG